MGKSHIDLKHELEELKRRAEGIFGRRGSVFGSGPFEGAFSPTSTPLGAARPGTVARLEDAVPGEEVNIGEGAFWRVLADAGAVWPDAAAFHREYLEALANPFFPAASGLKALEPLKSARPGSVCYLDIETTGLSMVPLFLVGLMYESADAFGMNESGARASGMRLSEARLSGRRAAGERAPGMPLSGPRAPGMPLSGPRLVVDQLFARDYSEEEVVLRFLAGAMPRFDILVTFNGITFDVPFIEDRVTIHRLSFSAPATHIDLLPIARGVVGAKTRNHRLQTLEAYLCGRKRIGDIAGADIPGAYHEYVRTRDAREMANVIHHNRLDLVTMLQLVTVFLSRES